MSPESVLNLAAPDAKHPSPSSSVFDLPTRHEGTTRTYTRPHGSKANELDNSPSAESSEQCPVSFVIISGGTGGNAICSAFDNACHVLPVSDDGGSSSEIIRVLGGPSIGDIRSRLVRLIPPAPAGSPLDATRNLLAYRLPSKGPERDARDLWRAIVEGKSELWSGISNDRKETIRGFLVYFENEILKRAHKNFSFLNGSIGNFFLAATTKFFRSLPAAIFLFSSITNSKATILPIIVTNHTVTIAAELENGSKVVGQCQISHPVGSDIGIIEVQPSSPTDGMVETVPFGHNVLFEPDAQENYALLESRISRLFYINAHGHEIYPSPNPDLLSYVASSEVLVYSCGSLWTSIIPCLAVRGVAHAIARSGGLRIKVLLLNSKNDRETDGYTAVDYINAITRTLNADCLLPRQSIYPVSAFITHLVYLNGGNVLVNVNEITAMGVQCVEVRSTDARVPPMFDAACIRKVMDQIWSFDEEGGGQCE